MEAIIVVVACLLLIASIWGDKTAERLDDELDIMLIRAKMDAYDKRVGRK